MSSLKKAIVASLANGGEEIVLHIDPSEAFNQWLKEDSIPASSCYSVEQRYYPCNVFWGMVRNHDSVDDYDRFKVVVPVPTPTTLF